MTFLPEADVDELLAELITVAQGAASVENLAPIATLLGQWRHTAEIYSGPAIREKPTEHPTAVDVSSSVIP